MLLREAELSGSQGDTTETYVSHIFYRPKGDQTGNHLIGTAVLTQGSRGEPHLTSFWYLLRPKLSRCSVSECGRSNVDLENVRD
uniref:Uncharacterized protein n=1 Tax=Hyaloperonospora arabidopsidis (strain Emoy2) TaxID=559515 RepID=M4BNU1_HYAAE